MQPHPTPRETVLPALSVIDGMISSLSRGGPGKEVTLDVRENPDLLTQMRECGVEFSCQEQTNLVRLVGTSCYEAMFLTRSTLEVIYDSIPSFPTLPNSKQFDIYRKSALWPNLSFVKYAKYFTAWPMARYLKNELPRRPDGFPGHPLIFGGTVKRILKNRLVSFSPRNLRLWAGFLQGIKRGCAPVSEDYIKQSMEGHRESLTRQTTISAEEEELLAPKARKLFGNFVPEKPQLYEATSSASFQTQRSTGGAREYIRSDLGSNPFEGELVAMIETRPGVVKEIRGLGLPDFTTALNAAAESPTSVSVSAVLEPLKVRLITKGDSYRYWVARFYQKSLWRHLQKLQAFIPTSRPINKGDLENLLQVERKLNLSKVQTFTDWVSGDYSAATDNLKIQVTKLFMEESLDRSPFNDKLKDVLRSVLYEQELNYPSKFNIEPAEQTTGQLMGSILSFPFLCLINLTAYWSALEEYLEHPVSLKHLPVLVNGDDILFRSNAQFYEIWQKHIASVGFTLSLGKNYIHPTVLTINSQVYLYNKDAPKFYQFRHMTYLNAGLLTGQSKITGRENAALAPIWDLYNETIPNAVNPERAHNRFIHYHKVNIQKYTRSGNFNLFLPFERGGLGFEQTPNVSVRYTSFQRRFANYLEQEYVKQVEAGEPKKAEKIRLVSDRPSDTVRFHHVPTLGLRPLIGPLPQYETAYHEREYQMPALAGPRDPERAEQRIRQPKLDGFRNSTTSRISTASLVSWNNQLVEVSVPPLSSFDPDKESWSEYFHHLQQEMQDISDIEEGLTLSALEESEWEDSSERHRSEICPSECSSRSLE